MRFQLSIRALLAAVSISISASYAGAQDLGPFRQFIALEPMYARLSLAGGPGTSHVGMNGYGGRLWINLAPFSGPSHNLIGKSGLAFFAVNAPHSNQGVSAAHYGAELDVYPLAIPVGYQFDPFLSLGGGVFRTRTNDGVPGFATGVQNKFALSPGGGIRGPTFYHLQFRADIRDAIVFSARDAFGKTYKANNIEFLTSFGLTF